MREFFNYIKKTKNFPVFGAEIGVLKGDNASDFIPRLNIDTIFLIDPWAVYPIEDLDSEMVKTRKNNSVFMSMCKKITYQKFNNNINVIIIDKPSNIASEMIDDCSLDFVYIDAKHHYRHVLSDCITWGKKIIAGGVIGGHDTDHFFYQKDIISAVNDFSKSINKKPYIGKEDWWIQL